MDNYPTRNLFFQDFEPWERQLTLDDKHLSLHTDANLDFRAPLLRDLTNYWTKVRASKQMPRRADVDPADMRFLLPHVFLIDVRPLPLQFRWRLLGTQVSKYVGYRQSGRWFHDVYDSQTHDRFVESFNDCLGRRRPTRVHGKAWFAPQDYLAYEAVYLPLSADGVNVNMILGGLIFTPSYWLESKDMDKDRGLELICRG